MSVDRRTISSKQHRVITKSPANASSAYRSLYELAGAHSEHHRQLAVVAKEVGSHPIDSREYVEQTLREAL